MGMASQIEAEQDLAAYQVRIRVAQEGLHSLSHGHLSYGQHRKREQRRRVFENEIKHVTSLIRIVTEVFPNTGGLS